MNKILTIEGLMLAVILSFFIVGAILIIKNKYAYKMGRSPKEMLEHSEDKKIDLSKDAEDK
tara:strand:+ start:439 stop:621 length:183 start_codon:yes stop_codon:yes gene_type:complete